MTAAAIFQRSIEENPKIEHKSVSLRIYQMAAHVRFYNTQKEKNASYRHTFPRIQQLRISS